MSCSSISMRRCAASARSIVRWRIARIWRRRSCRAREPSSPRSAKLRASEEETRGFNRANPGRARSLVPFIMRRALLPTIIALLASAALSGRGSQVLRSTAAVPASIAGRFREAVGFEQSRSGQYFVFDRRGHTVYGIDADQSSAWEIVQIGAESGHIIDPTAFAVEPDGTFVVADEPNNRERIQI